MAQATQQETTQPEQVAQPEQSTQTHTVDYQKQFEEMSGKYKELEGKYGEAESVSKNIEAYLNQDTVAAERAKIWAESQRSGKDFREMVKSLENPKPEKQVREQQTQQPIFDENKVLDKLYARLKPTLDPVFEQQAAMSLEKDKAQLFKDEPWLTEGSYKEFEVRYGKRIDELASSILSTKGPFISSSERKQAQDDAYAEAHGKFAHLGEKQLLNLFMGDERDKFIAGGRRPAPKLPNGMVDNLPTGKAPELLKQLKTKYSQIHGKADEVAKLCEEFAPQLGQTPEQVYAMLE